MPKINNTTNSSSINFNSNSHEQEPSSKSSSKALTNVVKKSFSEATSHPQKSLTSSKISTNKKREELSEDQIKHKIEVILQSPTHNLETITNLCELFKKQSSNSKEAIYTTAAITKAIDLAQGMLEPYAAFIIIAKTFIDSGDVYSALQIVNKHKKVEDRQLALQVISYYLIEKGEIDKALIVASTSIKDSTIKDEIFEKAALYLAQNSKLAAAPDKIKQINDKVVRDRAFEAVSIIGAKQGLFSLARKIAKLIKVPSLQSKTLSYIEQVEKTK
ncbi:MAG: hypothetical protein K0S74_584 [Chlamydiales bacterium]|jgi:hypothetical protein|nr:hypothetical protein [Chlamydiales bacterium]